MCDGEVIVSAYMRKIGVSIAISICILRNAIIGPIICACRTAVVQNREASSNANTMMKNTYILEDLVDNPQLIRVKCLVLNYVRVSHRHLH